MRYGYKEDKMLRNIIQVLTLSAIFMCLAAVTYAKDIGFQKTVGSDDMAQAVQQSIAQNTASSVEKIEALIHEIQQLLLSSDRVSASSRNMQRILDKQALIMKSQADLLKEQKGLMATMVKQMEKQEKLLARLVELESRQ